MSHTLSTDVEALEQFNREGTQLLGEAFARRHEDPELRKVIRPLAQRLRQVRQELKLATAVRDKFAEFGVEDVVFE